jgi:serine/threonine protein kinase
VHAQGIVHRDIKPDNLLLTSDDVLKIVDFGVSEMFEKNTPMVTAKTAGSPAFLPPELCVAGHGDISGCAADVWSMGVTLFCLFFGHLPFNYGGVMDLYNAIKNDTQVHLRDVFVALFHTLTFSVEYVFPRVQIRSWWTSSAKFLKKTPQKELNFWNCGYVHDNSIRIYKYQYLT